jgi:thiamine pyrophosphate-dependent acetolactate synthase large subunit-like protein
VAKLLFRFHVRTSVWYSLIAPRPNVLTNECDVLIALGMRFDDRVTGNLATYAKLK